MQRIAASLAALVTLSLPVAAQQRTAAPSPPLAATSYFPRAGREDPSLRAEMTRLLTAHGLPAPQRLAIVEPEWQTERDPARGTIARRTINAAVLYRDPKDGRLYLRFVLFAVEWSGRGRSAAYSSLYLRDKGVPRPFRPSTSGS